MKRIGAYLLALSIVWPLACTHASGQSLDSLWIRMVNDSTLVIRQETAPADTVLPQILDEPDPTHEQPPASLTGSAAFPTPWTA